MGEKGILEVIRVATMVISSAVHVNVVCVGIFSLEIAYKPQTPCRLLQTLCRLLLCSLSCPVFSHVCFHPPPLQGTSVTPLAVFPVLKGEVPWGLREAPSRHPSPSGRGDGAVPAAGAESCPRRGRGRK